MNLEQTRNVLNAIYVLEEKFTLADALADQFVNVEVKHIAALVEFAREVLESK